MFAEIKTKKEPHTFLESTYKEKLLKLKKYYSEIYTGTPVSAKNQVFWSGIRDRRISEDGRDSLFLFLPPVKDRGFSILERSMNALYDEAGITTKTDLLGLSPREIGEINRVGEKVSEFLELLWDLCMAEKEYFVLNGSGTERLPGEFFEFGNNSNQEKSVSEDPRYNAMLYLVRVLGTKEKPNLSTKSEIEILREELLTIAFRTEEIREKMTILSEQSEV